MLSSPSQSDATASPNSDDYGNDAKHLQNSNNKLRQMNEKLLLELTSIRQQFNEATSISNQLEQIHSKNTKLASDLRKVTTERDELSHRLDLNIQVIDEFRATKDAEKRENEIRVQNEIAEAKESYEKDKEELNQNLLKTQSDLKESLKLLKNSQNDSESMTTAIKDVIEAAQTYFIQPFKNLVQLTEFLANSANVNGCDNNKKAKTEAEEETNNKLIALNKKYKLLKQKAREEHKLRRDAENQAPKLENQIKSLKIQNENDKKSFDDTFNDLKRKMELCELQKKTLQSNYENQIADLQNKLSQQQQQQKKEQDNSNLYNNNDNFNNNNSEVAQLKEKVSANSNKIKETQASIFALRKQNSQLVNQLNESENAKEMLRRKINSLNEEIENLKTTNDQIRIENSAILIERDDLKEQNDTLLSQVQAARSSFNQSKAAYSEAECRIEKMQNSLIILEEMINKQKEEITQNNLHRNQYINAIHKQNEALHQIEDILSNSQEEVKQLRNKCNNMEKSKIMKSNNGCDDSDDRDIPATSFFCLDFPRPLCASISDIANNSALPTTAKLRNVLGTIAKFYNKKVEKLQQAEEASNEQFSSILEKMDNLFTAIGPMLLNDSTLCAESFLADYPRRSQSIINAITLLQSQQLEAKIGKTQLQKEVAEILKKLQVPTTQEALTALNTLGEKELKMKQQIESNRSKVKKLTKTIKALRNAAQQDIDDSQSQIESQTSEIKKLNDANINLQKQIKHDEDIIDQLTSQINSLQNSDSNSPTFDNNNNSIGNNKNDNNNNNNSLQQILENQKNSYDNIIDQKEQQISVNEEKIDQLERELTQYKKIVEMLKQTKFDKENQIANLFNEIDAKDKELRSRFENEKAQLKDQMERSLSQIKSKNGQLRDLVANVSNALNDSEERNKVLLTVNSQISIEKQQIGAKIDAIREEQIRDRQLSEARLKTLELSLSTQRQMDLEEERAKCDEQKRLIYRFVCGEFHQLLDARMELNEDGFRKFVTKCAAELKRSSKVEAALRRLLGLNPNEAIDDAVAKMLSSMYKH